MGVDDITVRMALLLLLLISSITLQATQAEANTLGLEDNLLWEKFKLQHMKAYPHREEEVRQGVFRANLRKIAAHNEREEQGLETWRMAVTEFADLTEEEFTQQVLGGYVRTPQSLGGHAAKREAASDLPASVDWREKGVVTDAKNQGSCGSCWAFATVENIESYAAINNVTLTKLSTQEVTTCTPNPMHCGGTGGCRGSIPQLGYNYVQLFGLATNADYPYWSGTTGMTGSCKDASPWQLYGSGVFSGCSYSSNIALNHAIQMVGYGTDPSHGDYWLVRNSWGKLWGEHGYIRLQREAELTCGTDSTPMDGTACVGGPGTDEQHVCGMLASSTTVLTQLELTL